MSRPRILVIDGNLEATRRAQVAAGGHASGEGYCAVLAGLADVECDVVRPADGAVRLRDGVALGDYDGAAMTGSALNVYDGGDHITRQVELMRAVLDSGVPCFGSCWGMQVAVTALGGEVRPNPLGREFGFGRRIALTGAGREHAMYRGKPAVFEAVTVHKDDVGKLPAGAVVLAESDMGIQALELRHGAGLFWGVQYHPEYSYAEIAATALRYGEVLVREQLFADRAALEAFVAELRRLQAEPGDRALNFRHGLGPAMRDPQLKLAELRNWIGLVVEPRHQRRH